MESLERQEIDNAVLATLITVMLIRSGGRFSVTPEEWKQAVADDRSLWVSRMGLGTTVEVVLMPPTIRDG